MNRHDDNRPDFHFSSIAAPRVILFILTICCICSMGFYYFQKRNIVSVSQAAGLVVVPFQKGINSVGTFFFDLDQKRLQLDEALAKIDELESENQQLLEEKQKTDQMVYDYQEAKALLELKDTYSEYDTTGAEVIFRDPSSNWFSHFTIDKGSADGIETGMNVIADGGLVGYVSAVSGHFSTVTTIINDNINVSGMQASTRDTCVVAGDYTLMKEQGLLRMDYMSSDFDISKDSTIITSRISDRYLPGIVIGYASSVSVNADKLTSSGYLKPAVDFKHLTQVLVITTKKEISE